MANIRKTFNFRNGVQVDDDNLIVNPNGLVGIGTSVPTELLDVRGTAKVVGLVTATEVFASNIRASGVSTFSGGIRAGIVSVSQSGIVTGVAGVVTYYGDGGRLLNLPTSQWLDVDIGLGFTSIYAQGFVGVSTVSPFYPFQVGGSDQSRIFTTVGANGVGIDSEGNIYATGITTAQVFVGSGAGITALNASNITVGTLNNARLASNINISGILTAPFVRSNNLVITGVTTSSGGFVGNVTGNVVGIASTALSLSGTPNIEVGTVTASQLISNISSIGISTVTNRLFVQNSIGVNTASPTAEVHVVKNGVGGVQVTSTQESYVGVARTLTRGQQGGEIRFGNLADTFSGQNSLDLVNYDLGSINQYIHRGAAGFGTGNFNWIYGQDQSAKMTLTYGGRLGIAKTNPDHELHVVGTSTITEDLYVGDDLFVLGDSNLVGDLTIGGNFTTPSLTVTGGISANLYNTTGVSTFYDINVTNTSKLSRIAISTDRTDYPIQIGNAQDSDVLVLGSGNFVGIGTTLPLPQVQIAAYNASAVLREIGVGTTLPRSAADFADAGKGYFSDAKRFLITPRVTTTERNALDISTVDARGAIVYNTSTNVHQAYNGSAWANIGSGGGGSISYADRAGIATYASIAGFATDSANVIGGIVTCTSLNVFPGAGGGISTFSGITTVTGPTLFTKQLNVSGVSTFNGNLRTNGANIKLGDGTEVTGNQIKLGNGVSADAFGDSADLWIYHNSTANLFQDITGTGIRFLTNDFRVRHESANADTILTNTTGNNEVKLYQGGNLKFETVGTGVTVTGTTFTGQLSATGGAEIAGVTTSVGGFTSGIGVTDPVQITVSGNVLTFTVAGVGSTSLTLF